MQSSPGDSLPKFTLPLLALIVVLFAVRNLPWHLDDYDQAKQAFVSFEMFEKGQWWFQHTPAGKVATKPPLAGWISAALYYASGKTCWELAWRLPPFVAALILLKLLWRSGRELAGPHGAVLAVSAFALNGLTTRLATLVRTDMFLTLLIFLAGWLVFEKVRRAEPWTGRDRAWLALTVFGALMTKGPILYAFLMPGLAAFWFFTRRRGATNYAWAGWLPWFAPMLAFAAWVGIGVWMSQEFYHQVVMVEFLGRFDMSDAPVHKHQPFFFYLPHLLGKWLPWSTLLGLLFLDRQVRARLRTEPALLWLLCWGVGGLIFMSIVPSKRVDRIFPIIPPLCLAIAAAGEWWCEREARRERWRQAVIAAGLLTAVSYTATFVYQGFRDDERNLVRFGQEVREIAGTNSKRFALADPDDEGLLIYTGQTTFLKVREAVRSWEEGQLDRLVIREKDLRENEATFAPYTVRLQTPKVKEGQSGYFLIERAAPAADTPKS